MRQGRRIRLQRLCDAGWVDDAADLPRLPEGEEGAAPRRHRQPGVEKERARQAAKQAEKESRGKGGGKGKKPAARPSADEEEEAGEAEAMDEDEAAYTPQRSGGGVAAATAATAAQAARAAPPLVDSARGEKRGRPAPTPGSLSSSSGAAKRRAAAAARAAAADPPTLSELIEPLIEAALLDFRQRSQRSFYRSMLRAAVRQLDR